MFAACITFLNWAAPTPWPMNEALMGPLVDTGCRFFTCGGAGYEKVRTLGYPGPATQLRVGNALDAVPAVVFLRLIQPPSHLSIDGHQVFHV